MSSLFSGMALSLASIGFLLNIVSIYLIKGRQNKGKGISKMFLVLIFYTFWPIRHQPFELNLTIYCAFHQTLNILLP